MLAARGPERVSRGGGPRERHQGEVRFRPWEHPQPLRGRLLPAAHGERVRGARQRQRQVRVLPPSHLPGRFIHALRGLCGGAVLKSVPTGTFSCRAPRTSSLREATSVRATQCSRWMGIMSASCFILKVQLSTELLPVRPQH